MQFLTDNFGAISAIGMLIIIVVSTIRSQGRIRSCKQEGDFYSVGTAENSGSVPPPNYQTNIKLIEYKERDNDD
jgi:hypothetical protein